MYLALRDLRHAKGRFGLIVTVVALMTMLVGFLSGLTGGLASQNISSILKLDVDRVVFSMNDVDDSDSFTGSRVSEEQVEAWRDADGVESAYPLGVAYVPLENDGADVTVALLAGDEGFNAEVPTSPGEITLSQATADELGVSPGDVVTMAGQELTVGELMEPQQFSHRDVAWTQLSTWRDYLDATRQPATYASVLLVNGSPDVEALDAAHGTRTSGLLQSTLALEAFKSEIGSLGLMIGMLMAIAVLVIGVFFLVWSMQRQRDVAVLKALGASDGWLARDALGQAFLVLLVGVGIGALATAGLGWLASQALPFVLSWTTLALPSAGMVLAGLLGALVSQRQITKADPLTALATAA